MIIELDDKEARADAMMLMQMGEEKLRKELLLRLDLLAHGQKGLVLGIIDVVRGIVKTTEALP